MNFRRLKAIALKEVLQVWRDPRSLMIVLLMPVMQMLMLGYGVSLDLKHLPVCLYDREGSQISQALMKRFAASPYFAVVAVPSSYAQVTSAIDAGTCSMAIVVPQDFSERLSDTGSASVQAILDASDDNSATLAEAYAQSVVSGFAADVQVWFSGSRGQWMPPRPPLSMDSRVWFNEDLESRNFIIPGVVAMVMALVGAQLTSLTIAREWERGTMELLVSTPVTPTEVMLGKLMPYFVIGLIDAGICLALAVLWFAVPFRGTLLTLFVTTSLFLVAVLGIGYLISVAIPSQVGASQIALLATMLPTALLSGYAFPIDQMPVPIQLVTYLVNARYYVTILKSIFLKGLGFGGLVKPIAALAVYAAVVGFLAARAFHKRLE
jgi:ABC-2 type transport system permease protein